MDNIWSENKFLNTVINILLFLIGINFMHYGQLLFPVVCFLLFLDHKLRFTVNNPLTFVLLCLFGVSFYAFSYRLGFYSVMGFICPMAYYIGSNMKDPDREKVRKVIYLFAFAMGMHIVLDFGRDLLLRGMNKIIHSSSHYDVWTGDKISSTAIAVELDLLMGILYYLLIHEKNKIVKLCGTIIFAIGMIYCILLGRRTPLLMFFVSMLAAFVSDKVISAEKRKKYLIGMSVITGLFVLMMALYMTDLFGIRRVLDHFYIFEKVGRGLADSRLGIYRRAFALLPKYLWGGQKISAEIGFQIHELWLDIYDYAGIVPYILIVIFGLLYGKNYICAVLKCTDLSYRTLLTGLFICIFIQVFLEPVMTGSSIFLMVVIIIGALIERLALNEQ